MHRITQKTVAHRLFNKPASAEKDSATAGSTLRRGTSVHRLHAHENQALSRPMKVPIAVLIALAGAAHELALPLFIGPVLLDAAAAS